MQYVNSYASILCFTVLYCLKISVFEEQSDFICHGLQNLTQEIYKLSMRDEDLVQLFRMSIVTKIYSFQYMNKQFYSMTYIYMISGFYC